MTDKSNYGSVLKKDSTVLGEITVLSFPEYTNPALESTNHSSGGDREYVSAGLRGLGEFTCKVNFQKVVASGILDDLENGTVGAYSIEFPSDTTMTWSFNALVIAFKPEDSDAQSPEVLSATVTLQPTGANTIG